MVARIDATAISHDLAMILRDHFPMLYKDVDITEGFERPCMTMEVSTIRAGSINELVHHDVIPITIYYFAPKRTEGYIDLLDKQEKLRQLLDRPLMLGGTYLYPLQELEFSIVKSDGSLIINLEYELYQARTAGEDMGLEDDWQNDPSMHPEEPVNEEMMEELYIDFNEEE